MKARLAALLLLLAAGEPQGDAFDHAVRALAAGSVALRTGDATNLGRAATDLRNSGAAAIDGEDVARRWLPHAKPAPSLPYRDRVLGPGYRTITLKSDGVWHLQQIFLAGQRARVAIVSAGAGSFAMHVTGDDGETVCRAAPPQRQCDWVPAYTARFSIEVRNSSRLAGQYFVIMQ